MIHLIKYTFKGIEYVVIFLVKLIMSLLFATTGGITLLVLTVVFFDERFTFISYNIIFEYIWGGKKKKE